MEAISGYLAPRDNYGNGNEFVLRTAEGKVRFSSVAAVPPMRVGDMITVVVSGGAICAITDLTTGAEFLYRPVPPYRSEKISFSTLFFLNFAIGMLPLIGFIVAKTNDNPFPSVLLPWAIAWAGIAYFLWRRTIANNYNIGLANRVQDAIRNSCSDISIWDIPERVEGEEQNWS
jgi:hypothetical protein